LKTLAPVRRRERDRIVREARAMAALNHECLATVYGLELWRETPVVVMEYLANGTLAERLVVGRLSANEAIALGIRLARALAYMHERGVLHCDLKPSNVGFNDAGEAKVLDFGLATLVRAVDEDGDAEPSRRGGTPAYLPRGAMGRPAEAGDDLWAVGVLLLESLTGANPFRPAHGFASRPRRQAHRLRAALRDSNIPQLLQPFFARAFASCPGDRFQSARALLDALRDLAASGRE
jgi:serine/threonine protein kinase